VDAASHHDGTDRVDTRAGCGCIDVSSRRAGDRRGDIRRVGRASDSEISLARADARDGAAVDGDDSDRVSVCVTNAADRRSERGRR